MNTTQGYTNNNTPMDISHVGVKPQEIVRRQLNLPPNLSHSLMVLASSRRKYEKGLNVNDLIVMVLQNYVQMPAIQKELLEAII